MGAIDGEIYTNRYEEFISNYEKGARIFEVDLIFTEDNHLVARHDWSDSLLKLLQQNEKLSGEMNKKEFMGQLINGSFAPLTLEDVFALIKEYPDAYIVTDTKETEESKIRNQFEYMVKAARGVDESVLKRVMHKLIHLKCLK